jgi:hypothetical protein
MQRYPLQILFELGTNSVLCGRRGQQFQYDNNISICFTTIIRVTPGETLPGGGVTDQPENRNLSKPDRIAFNRFMDCLSPQVVGWTAQRVFDVGFEPIEILFLCLGRAVPCGACSFQGTLIGSKTERESEPWPCLRKQRVDHRPVSARQELPTKTVIN